MDTNKSLIGTLLGKRSKGLMKADFLYKITDNNAKFTHFSTPPTVSNTIPPAMPAGPTNRKKMASNGFLLVFPFGWNIIGSAKQKCSLYVIYYIMHALMMTNKQEMLCCFFNELFNRIEHVPRHTYIMVGTWS